jgi:predicted DNA-binding protein YlxM (UPF0122 family)
MDKTKKRVGVLNDYYGGLLTKHQSDIVRLYYDFDMSLAEIGEEFAISRQGVKNILARAEKKLTVFDKHLGLYEKNEVLTKKLNRLLSCGDIQDIKRGILYLIEEI